MLSPTFVSTRTGSVDVGRSVKSNSPRSANLVAEERRIGRGSVIPEVCLISRSTISWKRLKVVCRLSSAVDKSRRGIRRKSREHPSSTRLLPSFGNGSTPSSPRRVSCPVSVDFSLSPDPSPSIYPSSSYRLVFVPSLSLERRIGVPKGCVGNAGVVLSLL